MDNMKRVGFRLPPNVDKAFKLKLVEDEVSIQEKLQEMIEKYINE